MATFKNNRIILSKEDERIFRECEKGTPIAPKLAQALDDYLIGWEIPPKITDLYRECGTYDEFMAKARDWGYDDEEADVLWQELTYKYEN